MKARKQPRSKIIDNELPLLPWNRQKAILKFFLYGTGADEGFFKAMSRPERRFYRAVIDVVDAYGPVADARYLKIIRMTPIPQ
jgi:hypothetical protein